MAKKRKTLPPEERLQAALVPEGEQPYPVPGKWCWVRLGLLLQSSKEKTEEFSDVDLKYVGLEHMQKDGGIVAYDSAEGVKSLKNVFHPQQILYGKLRPYLNKHDIVTFDGVCSTDILVFNIAAVTIPKFVNFFLDQDTFIEYTVSNSKGINLPRVSESVVLNAKCPLPPFAEQQRIVDRIENLFAKLDEAKQKAQDALDSFETRKAAILHKAFTGELTAKWRAEHGVGMTSWNSTTLAQVVSGFKYGTSEKSDYNNTGMPVLRIPNVGDGYVDFSDMKYLNHSDVDEESQIHEGDILIIRSNGSRDLVGKSVLVPKLDRPHAYASFLIRIKPSDIVKAEYLTLYLNSTDARSQMFRKAKSSAGINNINSKELGAIFMTLPSVLEQNEIVRILDSLFAKEQQSKEAAEVVLEKIDLLKKSILARAFRGELGTNDPTEESALELLKQVLQ